MRLWIPAGSLLAVVGCTQTDVLELPPLGGDTEYFALLTLDGNGRETGGTGLLTPTETVDLEVSADSTRFWVATYDEGVLDPIDDEVRMQRVHLAEPSSTLLPTATRFWEADRDGVWRQLDASIALTAEWLPPAPCSVEGRAAGLCPCRSFVTSWATEIPGPIERAEVTLVDDTVYTFARPTREEPRWTWALPLTEGSTGSPKRLGVYPGSTLEAQWAAPDGAIWLAGDLVTRWDRASPTAEVVHAPTARVYGISGAAAGSPTEIYLSERGGRVERFDGVDWELVYENDAEEPGANQSGRVVWLSPGRAVAALFSQRNLLFYEHGQDSILERRSEGLNAAEVLTLSETMGLLWGSATGQLAQLVDRRFELLPRVDDSPLTGKIEAMEAYPGGAVYATVNGWVGQVHEEVGVCVPQLLSEYSEVMGAGVRGEEVVIVGRGTDGNVRVEVLRPE